MRVRMRNPTRSQPMSGVPEQAAYNAGAAGDVALETLESAVGYNRWLCSHLRPYLGDRNVELGAGHGTLTAIMGETHHVLPVEPSKAGRKRLSERFDEHPRVATAAADLADVTQSESFDCIYSSNVLEHIPDDLAVISAAAELLKPGGHFVALVPCGMWLFSDLDRDLGHVRRYTDADRRRIARHIRPLPLEMVRWHRLNPIGALGWFVKMRLLRQRRIRSADAAMAERLLPLIKLTQSLPLPFGQSLLMALRRQTPSQPDAVAPTDP